MSTAAAWSTTARCRRPATPLSRSVRCASTVVSRSSTRRTGTGATRAATRRYLRARAAAGPSCPDSDRGSPTTTSTASCSAPARRSLESARPAAGSPSAGGHRLHRRGEQPVGVAAGRPRRAPPDVDAEPHAASQGSGISRRAPRRALDGRERLGDLGRVLAAALGDVVLAAAAAAEGLGGDPDQLAGLDAALAGRLVGGHDDHRAALATPVQGDDAGRLGAEPAAHVEGQLAQVVGAGAVAASWPTTGHAVDVPGAPASPPAAASTCSARTCSSSFSASLSRVDHAGDPLGQLLAARP